MYQRKLWFALPIFRYKINNLFVTDVKFAKIFLGRVISSCFVMGKLLSQQPNKLTFLTYTGLKNYEI